MTAIVFARIKINDKSNDLLIGASQSNYNTRSSRRSMETQLYVRDCVLIHDSATTKENDRGDVTLDVLEAHNLLKSTRGWSTDEKSGTKR